MSSFRRGFWFCYGSYLDWDRLMFGSHNRSFSYFKFFRCLGQIEWLT